MQLRLPRAKVGLPTVIIVTVGIPTIIKLIFSCKQHVYLLTQGACYGVENGLFYVRACRSLDLGFVSGQFVNKQKIDASKNGQINDYSEQRMTKGIVLQ